MNETGLEIFLNVSVNFPEINIVKYEYNNDLLIIEVVLTREIDSTQKESFISKAQQHINALHTLNRSKPETLSIRFKSVGGLTFLRLYRDAQTLGGKEINLFMTLLGEEFYDCLLDEGNSTARPSFRRQVEKDLLKKLGASSNTDYLFAYRDHGKLCMFNR
ncbi:hypothetical protein [Syntrophomonas curvata]